MRGGSIKLDVIFDRLIAYDEKSEKSTATMAKEEINEDEGDY